MNETAQSTIAPASSASNFLDTAKQTGIEIKYDGNAIVWAGEYGGNEKPKGPLAGKKVGALVASEFSDFQAYYLVSYIGEFGGQCEFLLVDWVNWKYTRPTVPTKGVEGMWGLHVDPIAILGGNKPSHYKSLKQANPADYDAIVVLGGHSADIMVTEVSVIDFIEAASKNGAVMGSIGAGAMPLIKAGIMNGKNVTGNRVVDYMLKKIAKFKSASVVRDGKLVTARDTVDTARFLRELCKAFKPDFVDPRENILKGKKVLTIAGEDFEDMELVVTALEFLYRGAELIFATYTPLYKARPALLGLDVVTGNYGATIPFQEIPDSYYTVKKLSEVKMIDFDLVQIPGAFCPWSMVETGTTEWLKEADAAGKIITAVCHGPIPVAAADLAVGKTMTGWLSCEDSVKIMGGNFKPEYAVVIDGNIVTGRTAPELPEFIDAMTEALLK